MSQPLCVVITTVQRPTACCVELARRCTQVNAPLLVIGDSKGPDSFEIPGAAGVRLYSLAEQQQLPYRLAKLLPTGHYARKNLGYLLAMAGAAECIYETDDDNQPLPGSRWAPRSPVARAQAVAPRPWFNVYRVFTDALVWPRGYPLDRITDATTWQHELSAPLADHDAPIQQGLADHAPDVDAVWRLVLDRPFDFEHHERPALWLPPNTWCPFNSQSTWWWPRAYPLMYLPSYCSFRMTDIWRSFIAQRCLWAMGLGVVFHRPEVRQDRNTHNLMRDFADEVPGYTGNDRLARILAGLELSAESSAIADNLRACYAALIEAGFFPPQERLLVQAWCDDLAQLGCTS